MRMCLNGRSIVTVLLLAMILVGSFVSALPAAAGGIPECSKPGQITPHPKNWYSIKAPIFPSGPQLIRDYAVEPLEAERLYATNGVALMKSVDSGCNWSLSYTLPTEGSGVNAANGKILEIEVSAPGTVYLPIQQTGPPIRPHVVITRDAGETWTDASGPPLAGLAGILRDFDASHANPLAAAMLVDPQIHQSGIGAQTDPMLLVTSTGGETWEPRHPNPGETKVRTPVTHLSNGISATGDLRAIAMNPIAPSEIWLYGDGGVFHSDGTTLARVDIGPLSVLDIALDGQSILAYEDGSTSGQISFDGGRSFETFPTGLSVDSIDTTTGLPSTAVLSALGRVFIQNIFPGQTPIIRDISPVEGSHITDVSFALSKSVERPLVFGTTGRTIEVAFEPAGRLIDPKTELMAGPPLIDVSSNYLQPASKRVVMRPGQSRTVGYELGLPAASTLLDVYFMIDISGSMDGAINGVRSGMRDIVNRLAANRIDVHFGIGAFRAYNDPPPYQRVRDIGPVNAQLAEALNSLSARGGGEETQMAALMQSVTGSGYRFIQPNLNMHFRPGSLRVAIEVTDEVISQGENHPPYTEVAAILKRAGVRMVGLAIQEEPLLAEYDYENPGEPAGVLQKVAH